MNTIFQQTEWDEGSTKAFLAYAEGFVPYREIQYRTICRLLSEVRPSRVVELCCGQGKLCRMMLETLPGITLRAYDGSELMLETARNNLSGFHDRFQADLFDVHATAWRRFSQPVDAFVSSLALHHLTADEKGGFYKDLYRELSSGGILVNADLVWPPSVEGQKDAAAAWDDWVKQFSNDNQDGGATVEAFESLRWNMFRYPEDNSTDHPLPVAQELELLENAGFAQLDIAWMYAGHAIIAGRKL